MIEDTSKRDPNLHLLAALDGAGAEYVTGMESAGQRQLVESTDLPTQGSDDPEFLKLGFTFGEPHAHDPLFRPATLPAGWKKQAKEHAMGSAVVDEHGRERVSVFYKAAFYDRRADMHLVTVFGYVSTLLYYGGEPVLDDEWATAAAVIGAARGEIAREEESLELWQRPDVVARNDAKYIAERVAECRADIAKAEALIARVSS